MTEIIDWDDAESCVALLERLGPEGYAKALEEHWAATTVDIVNGYPIRTVTTRFGRLFGLVYTDRAFTTIDEAREFASKEPALAKVEGR